MYSGRENNASRLPNGEEGQEREGEYKIEMKANIGRGCKYQIPNIVNINMGTPHNILHNVVRKY